MRIWGQLFGMFGTSSGARRGAPSTTTLTASMADSADPVWNVEALAYTTTITNVGAADASNVVATITLDASVAYVSSSGTGWTLNRVGQVVTASRATLAPGAAPDIVINVTTADAAATISSGVSVVADNATTPGTDTETTAVELVTRDATSGKRVPASTAEWTRVMARAGLASGNPSALWLFQEVSGNPADSIGAFALTAGGTAASYQQAVAGWTRLGISVADGATSALTTTNASLPDTASASHLVLAYVKMPAAGSGTARNVVCLGATATRTAAEISVTTGKLRARSQGNTADSVASHSDGAVRPIVIRTNRTASEADAMSELEKMSPTFDAITAGKGVRFGAASLNAAAVTYLYAVSFHAAAAELTDAQIKTLLQTLGWTVAW